MAESFHFKAYNADQLISWLLSDTIFDIKFHIGVTSNHTFTVYNLIIPSYWDTTVFCALTQRENVFASVLAITKAPYLSLSLLRATVLLTAP